MLKVLVGCEESQTVTIAFRELGYEAYSCDLKPCSGGHPEWHLQGDVFDYIHIINPHLFIVHPPCTDLAVSGAAHFAKKIADGRQQKSIDLFLRMVNVPIKHIATENPIGIMSSKYRAPDQIIQPYHFGDTARKPTCLWLKNLPKLVWIKEDDLFSTKTCIEPEIITMQSRKTGRVRTYSKWEYEASCNQQERQTIRSKTFPGIAKAMAEQWGNYLTNKYNLQ